MYEQRLKATSRIRWQKPVVVLTNRGVYSAANEFTKYMKALGAIIVGDHTGGGAGMPFTSELPNGWLIRFSACPTFDINKQCVEEGIAPHHNVSLTDEDTAKGKDTIIEYARKVIKTL
jgi:C-terminal processing protease CtpA/Prc